MKTDLKAFTIVELIVVIVVIAILAAITIVSYTGITGRSIIASIQSDLDNNSKQIKLYYAEHGEYPYNILDTDNYCPKDINNNIDSKYCLKASNSTTLTYTSTPNSDNKFKLVATKDTTSLYVTQNDTFRTGGKNLLTSEDASVENGMTNNWWFGTGGVTNSLLYPFHGAKSLKFALSASPGDAPKLNISFITSAGLQYTASAYVTATLSPVTIALWDNVSGTTGGNTISVGNSGRTKVTKTFNAGSTGRVLYIGLFGTTYPAEAYADAIQLETGGSDSPF